VVDLAFIYAFDVSAMAGRHLVFPPRRARDRHRASIVAGWRKFVVRSNCLGGGVTTLILGLWLCNPSRRMEGSFLEWPSGRMLHFQPDLGSHIK
jgi:hypothetical protein